MKVLNYNYQIERVQTLHLRSASDLMQEQN